MNKKTKQLIKQIEKHLVELNKITIQFKARITNLDKQLISQQINQRQDPSPKLKNKPTEIKETFRTTLAATYLPPYLWRNDDK